MLPQRPVYLIVRLLRNWRRGFTDNDVKTAELKMAGPHRPGAVIAVSKGELNAINDILANQPNGVIGELELMTSEHNFCRRCGKRTSGVHTCTPPSEAFDAEIFRLREENERLRRGEFICQKCGIRKNSERDTVHEF